MRIGLLGNKIKYLDLPSKLDGSYWLTDIDNTNLVSIEAQDNKWVMNSNDEVYILRNNVYTDKTDLEEFNFYTLQVNNQKKYLFTFSSFDESLKKYYVQNGGELKVGSGDDCSVIYNDLLIPKNAFNLTYNENAWTLNQVSNSLLYINSVLCTEANVQLHNGDVLFSCGITMIPLGNIIMINNPKGLVRINSPFLQVLAVDPLTDFGDKIEVKEKSFYSDADYYMKSPRINRTKIKTSTKLASPPAKAKEEDTPLIYVLGPMLTTSMVGFTTFANNLTKITSGDTTIEKIWPQLVTSVATIASTLLWPNLSKKYKKKQERKKEDNRQSKYKEYLAKKEKEINEMIAEKSRVLKDSLVTSSECLNIIKNKDRRIWEKNIDQDDFLTVRVGTGNLPSGLSIDYSVEEFSMEDDNLKKDLENVAKKGDTLFDVPISYSFLEQKITAILGYGEKYDKFIKSLILQLITFQSYDQLKLAIFTNSERESSWQYLKNVPHLFTNDRKTRFFASTRDERMEVGNYLLEVFNSRYFTEAKEINKSFEYKKCKTYYIIITDDVDDARKFDVFNQVLESEFNVGFSIIILENKMSKLPDRCTNFISLGQVTSDLFENSGAEPVHQTFNDDLTLNPIDDNELKKCCDILSNIPIRFDVSNRYLPDSLSFLEMFNVGKVEQLSSMNRWKDNNPIKTLKAQIGIDDLGEPIYLDLHEKAHGPHGLIAGTTGSGKSEFIITYILSLALNYSPHEVAFILIDYKGGGLVGAFENAKLGLKLPHLAGKITNLDKAEMKRTLVSINSELQRRQRVFNEARDKTGESTIDIYKYQRLYREGKLTEPMPHMFIISDEFAELKSQQPEFMDNLISAARIGRSLGVHLILATQKPTGVVNDQIWSNTKFRVCLKVQDKSDSNEMIKRPDAAEIKQAGRFYLQVGYNEIFILGQSGYTGAKYVPSNMVKKKYDRSVSCISNTGNIISSFSDDAEKVVVADCGDQLTNVLKYICDIAAKENVYAAKMWLDSIPEMIYTDQIIQKYNFQSSLLDLQAVVGEYDDPNKQMQGILTIPLVECGNTAIYGSQSSDRERMLNSLIYSLVSRQSPEVVNFYIVDYGAETLRMFSKFPHVGDIVYNGETEKFTNLLKMLDEEVENRKKLFMDYSGKFSTYCKTSGNIVPLIVVIVNDIDALYETNPLLDDRFGQICRDSERYGIDFVFTGSSYSSIKSKLRKCINNHFALEINNTDDYTLIVGNWKKVCLFGYPGRGLVNLGGSVYEFQTCHVCDDESLSQNMATIANNMSQQFPKKVKRIPVLPESIDIELLKDEFQDLHGVPIGIKKSNLETVKHDFKSGVGNLIASNEMNVCVSFMNCILREISNLPNVKNIVIDSDKVFEKYSQGYQYVTENFDATFDSLKELVNDKQTTYIITIFEVAKLKNKCDVKKIDEFTKVFKSSDNIVLNFVSTASKVKDLSLDTWYVMSIDKQTGIWLGDGVIDQGVIRTSTLTKDMRNSLAPNFGWYIKNGALSLVKFIDSVGGENNGQ